MLTNNTGFCWADYTNGEGARQPKIKACADATGWCPQQDSNLRLCLRRATLYPLSYGGVYEHCTTVQGGVKPAARSSVVREPEPLDCKARTGRQESSQILCDTGALCGEETDSP